jgi:hypothetical protein
MTDKDKIKLLREALIASKEHHEYCGYGDRYERDCAREQKLPELIEKALDQTK